MIRNKKTGQMEMLGLAMVIVIVSMVLFFFIAIQARSTPKQFESTYRKEQMALNMLQAMLETTIGSQADFSGNSNCADLTLNDLIYDCASDLDKLRCEFTDQAAIGADTSIVLGPGSDTNAACRDLAYASSQIFQDSIKKWGESYRFVLKKDSPAPLVELSNLGCDDTKEAATTGWLPISLYPHGEAELELRICNVIGVSTT